LSRLAGEDVDRDGVALADRDRAEVGELAGGGEAQVLAVRREDEDRHLVALGAELGRDALDDPLGHVQEQLEGVADLPLLAGHGRQDINEILHPITPRGARLRDRGLYQWARPAARSFGHGFHCIACILPRCPPGWKEPYCSRRCPPPP